MSKEVPAQHDGHRRTIDLTTEIVAAYVSNNPVNTAELPDLIASVHDALKRMEGSQAPQPREELRPAVPIKRSVTEDFIICLEDGKKFKSLKRHLKTRYNMTPEQYRERWGLPHDYPMVSPNYAKKRSAMAKQQGLGTRRDE